MKVALIIDTWFPQIGGGQINAIEISKRIANKNCLIDIITRDCGKYELKLSKYLSVIKLGNRQNPNSYFSKIIFIFSSFLYILKNEYDLVHAHAFLPGLTAKLIMIFKKIPALYTVHGTSINSGLNNKVKNTVEKFIITKIHYNAQITVSRDFQNIKNINEKIVYIPNGVNIKIFNKVRKIKNKNIKLIFVGRLHKQKNLKALLISFAKILRNWPKMKLIIVGKGPMKNELKALAETLKVSRNIVFRGQLHGNRLVEAYKSSDLLVLTSLYEGQPLVLLEAWAAKLPVVVSKTGDCQFLVKNSKNGYLIDNPKKVSDITNTIEKALKNNNLREMGENGYNLVKKNFSWERSARSTFKVYESLLSTRS